MMLASESINRSLEGAENSTAMTEVVYHRWMFRIGGQKVRKLCDNVTFTTLG